jgi:hypothetical protein
MLLFIWRVRGCWLRTRDEVTLSCSTVMSGSIRRSECVSGEVTQMLRTMMERDLNKITVTLR